MSLLTKNVPPLLVITLSGILSLLAYPYLESRVPVHWGATGIISTYADREVAIFLNPAGACIAYLFFLVIPYADKRKIGQLRRIGLYEPLRNFAIYGFGYAHLLGIGIGVSLLPRHANYLGGLAGLLFFLIGWELRLPDPGLPALARRLSDGLRGRIGSLSLWAGAVALGSATAGITPLIWATTLTVTAVWSMRCAWHEFQQ